MVVGRVGPAHGLDGTVVVDVDSDSPELRFGAGKQVRAGERSLTVARYQATDRSPLITFEEIRGREAAVALRGTELTVLASARRELGGDEFWPDDLIGLTLVDESGRNLGSIVDVDFGTGQSRLIVETEAGSRAIPFVEALIPEVDLAKSQIVGRFPPGLMD